MISMVWMVLREAVEMDLQLKIYFLCFLVEEEDEGDEVDLRKERI